MSSLVATCEGQFIKSIPLMPGKQIYGLHSVFGLVNENSYQERMDSVRRKGGLGREKAWLCRFHMEVNAGKAIFKSMENCQIEMKEGAWWIYGAGRTLRLGSAEGLTFGKFPETVQDTSKRDRSIVAAGLLFFVVFMSGLIMWSPTPKEEIIEEVPEPLTVVITKRPTITVSAAPSVVQPKNATEQTKRAVQQNLGFLGLVGKKDLKKAVGGAQLDLSASPGAGKGGNAGSGGEVLSGLGRGVRATTVGNSGVQGLGGVGTKGAGGGLGGYGDVDIASGEGRGISAIAVSQGVGVDGGLDRHVIQATIAKYLNQVRACYEDRLRLNPGLAGTLAMDFEIGPAGRLNFAKVKSSSVGDPLVGDCVSKKMMGWEFPKPRGGVNVAVNYPFALRPVGR